MNCVKPIETIYNGYRFRSRLEARWAVFFDALGIDYEYEKEGYQLSDGTYYLPDFWLPKYEQWIEIDGQFERDIWQGETNTKDFRQWHDQYSEKRSTKINRMQLLCDDSKTLSSYVYFGPPQIKPEIGDLCKVLEMAPRCLPTDCYGFDLCSYRRTTHPLFHLYTGVDFWEIEGAAWRALEKVEEAMLIIAAHIARSARFEYGEMPLTEADAIRHMELNSSTHNKRLSDQ